MTRFVWFANGGWLCPPEPCAFCFEIKHSRDVSRDSSLSFQNSLVQNLALAWSVLTSWFEIELSRMPPQAPPRFSSKTSSITNGSGRFDSRILDSGCLTDSRFKNHAPMTMFATAVFKNVSSRGLQRILTDSTILESWLWGVGDWVSTDPRGFRRIQAAKSVLLLRCSQCLSSRIFCTPANAPAFWCEGRKSVQVSQKSNIA